jgi:hypothetical protein
MIPLIASLVLILNIFPDFNNTFELTFHGVDEESNRTIAMVFAAVVISNYALETTLKYLRYGKLYDYI